MTSTREPLPSGMSAEIDGRTLDKVRAAVQEVIGEEFILDQQFWREGAELHVRAGVQGSRRQFLVRVLLGQRLVPRAHRRMQRELQLADRLEHPNLERILTGGSVTGVTVCVCAWPENGNLGQRLREVGFLELKETITILRHVASALDYTVRIGTFHGRLTPASIWLHSTHTSVSGVGCLDDPKLPAPQDELALPHVAAYLAPEQWQADGEVNAHADQYAMAVIAYEALTGHRRVETSTAGGLPTLTLLEIAPDVPLRQGIPLRVNAALRKALARDPQHRFASSSEFVAALAGEIETPRSMPTVHERVTRRDRSRAFAPPTVVMLLLALMVAAVLPPGRLIVRRELPAVDGAFTRLFTWIGVELPGGPTSAGARREPLVNVRLPGDADGGGSRPSEPARTEPVSQRAPQVVPTQLASDPAASGSIRVEVSEGDALVLVNGSPAGVTPLTLSMPAGVHRVSVTRVGSSFSPSEATVAVTPGQTAEIRFSVGSEP